MIEPAELGELEAMRSLIAAWPGSRVEEIGGALCTGIEATPRSAMFNRALGLGLREPASEEGLDAIERFFAELGLSYGIPVTPDARPDELPRWLEARGYHRGYAWTKFRRGREPVASVETDLRVERIDAGRGDVFADVFSRAYGTPELLREWLASLPGGEGWQCFVAYADETPAATGALFLTAAGGEAIGWLGAAGTLPEFRRRGAQSALLAARVRAGLEAGCSGLVTETGEPRDGRPSNSYRDIVRAGFAPLYARENYLSSADADTSGTQA